MSDETKKDRNLTVKEQKLVTALASGHASSATEAVQLAGYAAPKETASTIAARIMKRPAVRNALISAIEERFPDLASKGAALLNQILEDPDASYQTKLKAMEYMMKLFGWQAPTKHMSLHKDLDKYELPTGEED